MPNKSDTVRELVANGKYIKALQIAKHFVRGIDKEIRDKLLLGYECYLYPEFYKMLNVDTETAIAEGIEILKKLYG